MTTRLVNKLMHASGAVTGALLAITGLLWLFVFDTYSDPPPELPQWVSEWIANPPAVVIPTNLVIHPASGGEE